MAHEEFDHLPFANSPIRQIYIKPGDLLSCEIMAGPFEAQSSPTGEAIRVYKVEFSNVGDFRFALAADPWLEVISNRCLSESNLLDAYRERNRENPKPMSHFQLILGEGSIDILATGFSYSILQEIPFVRTAKDSDVRA